MSVTSSVRQTTEENGRVFYDQVPHLPDCVQDQPHGGALCLKDGQKMR